MIYDSFILELWYKHGNVIVEITGNDKLYKKQCLGAITEKAPKTYTLGKSFFVAAIFQDS